jgi:4-amino-4-deoxy-L-arabinose transferase-like glycosyltransferase
MQASGHILATTTSALAATTAEPARREIALLKCAVGIFVALKLVYGTTVPPGGDEAYYWLWGGYLQLSYFDHSPMVGWLGVIGRSLLGWTPAGLHLPAFATFLVLAFGIYRAAAWLAPEDRERYFWLTLATFCASPLLNVLTTLNYPDHALICFAGLALLQLGKYLNGVLVRGERQADLYSGAALLGLAGLSKYNAVFIPAGLVVVLIAVPHLRRLFASPHLYLAGALTFSITLPVFIWNAENRFATFEFHAGGRLDAGESPFEPLGLVRLLVVSLLAFSPFLAVPFWHFLFGRVPDHRNAGAVLLGRATALVSGIVVCAMALWGALTNQVSAHWMVLTFLPFLILSPLFLRSRLAIWLHLGWGLLITTVALLYYLLTPIPANLFGADDSEAGRLFGQDQLAAAVTRAAEANEAELIAVSGYPILARLAFGMGDGSRLTDLGGRIDRLQKRAFTDADAGQDMILIGRPDQFEQYFERIERIDDVQTWRWGRPLEEYNLLVGRGFKPGNVREHL